MTIQIDKYLPDFISLDIETPLVDAIFQRKWIMQKKIYLLFF